MKRLLLAFLASVAIALSMFAQGFTYDGVRYTVISSTERTCKTNSGTVSVPGNPKTLTSITLHENPIYDGVEYTLIEIGDYSFYDNTTATGSLTIPNSVTTIGESASATTVYTNASGTYSLTDSNILKVEWSAMTVDGESDSAFTTFYLMGAASVEGSTMQWDYSIYDKSTSTVLAGPFTAKFTRNN